MPLQLWRSPGKGGQETDSLLEAALSPESEDVPYKVVEDEDDSSDEDEDQQIKDIRAERLKETGGWFGYLKDFNIFLPFIVPRNDIKVQFCLLICICTSIVERVVQVAIPITLGIIADKVTSRTVPMKELLIYLSLDMLHSECGMLFLQELAKVQIKQFSYTGLSNAAFNHVMAQSIDFHSTQDTAEVMKAVEQGESLALVLDTIVTEIIPTVVDTIIACIIFYHKFDYIVAGLLCGASITYLVAEAYTTNVVTEDRRVFSKTERLENKKMHQSVQGWQTVAYFNAFRREADGFSKAVREHMKAKTRFENRQALLKALVELLIPLTFFGLAYLILRRISTGNASPGGFVFFLTYWDSIIYPLKFLTNNVRWLAMDFVNAERLLQLLRTQPSIVDAPNAWPLRETTGEVHFEGVTFQYEEGRCALRDVSFTVQPGQTVALVGETGSGKSSILKLILRLYDINSGNITISGQPIHQVTIGSLRHAISVVPQTPMFFNASIMENVRYARSNATDAEVKEACRVAAIHDTIMRCPNGYDTEVGERGVKLSGGEAQRLAIARALLKDAPIVLFDEATSAVDTITEGKIKLALEKLSHGRIVIVIAHRLSTVVDADQILVLHEGRIVEKGTHKSLCEEKGRYWKLWEKS